MATAKTISSKCSLVASSVLTEVVHNLLLRCGIQPQRLPSTDSIVFSTLFTFVGGLLYMIQSTRRKSLADELEAARAELQFLQEKLSRGESKEEKKPIRIFMDGAFDMLHFGHMNAFRLARSLGTELIVGVNSDASITECKASPLMNDEERLMMVKGCKFVDQVVPNCPYIMNKEYLDWVIKTYKVDYVVHGSDPCIVGGMDVYETAKEAGKYRSIPRTEGVSTTDIVGRMLLLTKQHHFQNSDGDDNTSASSEPISPHSRFLMTSRMMQLFSAGLSTPKPANKVIYVDGSWDLFHPGHVSFLKQAREMGDFLLVGIHSDKSVNRQRGGNLPLMNLHERVLSVLGCRYVSDVLIDAPYQITTEMMKSFHVSQVVRGSSSSYASAGNDDETRYKVAMDAGVFKVIQTSTSFDIHTIFSRIKENQQSFQTRFERKMQAESNFYRERDETLAKGDQRQ